MIHKRNSWIRGIRFEMGPRHHANRHDRLSRRCLGRTGRMQSDEFSDQTGPGLDKSAVDGSGTEWSILIKAEEDGVQAVIIDCMLDPGLDAAREAVSILLLAVVRLQCVQQVQIRHRQYCSVRTRLVNLARRYEMADRMTEIIGIGVLALESDRKTALAATIESGPWNAGQHPLYLAVPECLGLRMKSVVPSTGSSHRPSTKCYHGRPWGDQSSQTTNKAVYPYPDPKPIVGFREWAALDAFMRSQADD